MKRFALPLLSMSLMFSASTGAAPKLNDVSHSLLANAAAVTAEFQSLDEIRSEVETFILSSHAESLSVSATVKALDNRLRLVSCQVPLEPTWSNRSRKLGRVTVQVACSSPKPWRVHVQATVTMKGMVWALARGVQRDQLLSRDVLIRQEVTMGANNAAFTSLGTPIVDIEPWLGFAFAQRVNGGKVLNERMLKPAMVLNKGDAVVIRHRSKGLELQTRGVALSDAGAQQQTQVRNSSSGKIIDVVVVSPGIVEIFQ
ncbi:MAG: flagellar basal body P-ring formation chaperone FlgA [Granulosicoccus sp.]